MQDKYCFAPVPKPQNLYNTLASSEVHSAEHCRTIRRSLNIFRSKPDKMSGPLVWKRKNSNGLAWRNSATPNTPAMQAAASSRFSSSAWPPKRTFPESSCIPESQTLNSHGKPLRRELAKHRYRLGTIVRAPLHEEDYSGGNCESYPPETRALMKAKTITESPVGGVIHTKFRKFIVVALFDDHYLAVPLYSYNGDGLIEKKADEYISVQDHRADAIKPQSRHGLLCTGELESHVDHYEPMTSAHFAYPVARKYKLPVVYEGELRADSTKLLLRLYRASMIGGAELESLLRHPRTEVDSKPKQFNYAFAHFGASLVSEARCRFSGSASLVGGS